MDEQTRKLLEECSSGCKMAVNSMEQVSEYIKDTKLKELADSFTEKHRELEAETAALLNDAGNDEKAPGAAASTFAWFTTEIKLAVNSDNTHRQASHGRLQYGHQDPGRKTSSVLPGRQKRRRSHPEDHKRK